MDRFVRVRIVQANALNLAQFQFDFDLTFAAFLMNVDGTIYGRYGTRSSQKAAASDISIEGFREALEGALKLHAGYPANRRQLAAKRSTTKPRFPVPEQYPDLRRFKAKLDYKGQVARSCMHCHMVQAAERKMWRTAGKPVPDHVLYPWPLPRVVGLKLDPKRAASVLSVEKGSAAERAGFRQGDRIATLGGQPLVSIADVQWVLHNAGDTARLTAGVFRENKATSLTMTLSKGWRRRSDIAWRTTTWDLRRMATGGLVLEDLSAAARKKAKLGLQVLALRVKHVGQYNEHAVAKRAGFRKGDIIVTFGGSSLRITETQLIARGVTRYKRGQRIPVTVLRAGRRVMLQLPMQ